MSNESVVTATRTSSAVRPGRSRHRREEVDERAVRDLDALRRARRAGGVDDVRELVRRSPSTAAGSSAVRPIHSAVVGRGRRAAPWWSGSARAETFLGDEHRNARVLEHESLAIERERRIDGNVGAAGLQDPEQRRRACRASARRRSRRGRPGRPRAPAAGARGHWRGHPARRRSATAPRTPRRLRSAEVLLALRSAPRCGGPETAAPSRSSRATGAGAPRG